LDIYNPEAQPSLVVGYFTWYLLIWICKKRFLELKK
jgi:hypothetical protein